MVRVAWRRGLRSHLVRVPDQRRPGDAEGARGLVADHRGTGGGAGHQLGHAPRPAQPRHPHLPPPRQPPLHPLAGQSSHQVGVEEDDLPVVAVLAVLARHHLAHQVGAAPDSRTLHRWPAAALLNTWSWSTRSPPSRPACTAPGSAAARPAPRGTARVCGPPGSTPPAPRPRPPPAAR